MDTNVAVLQGRLTRDPETKYIADGTAVTAFSLAVSGFKKDQTDFFDVECWGKTAEFAGKYLNKGSAVVVTARLQQQRWDDKTSGQKRSKVVMVASQITFAGGAKSESRDGGEELQTRSEPAPVVGGEDVPF